MAPRDKSLSQPADVGSGQPTIDSGRISDVMLTEIAKIQSDGEYLKRDLSETRGDMRDIRDRMTRLEVRVDHLPSKGYIAAVVVLSLTIIGGLLTVATMLQRLAGMNRPPIATSK